jgi:type I site-specific restriction-modification system R (restriction) subunit
LHPDRIGEISQYILNNFRQKTHRKQAGGKGFNALFAVSSVDAAKAYYITNSVGNHIGMQLTAKHATRGFSTQGIL